MYIVYNVYKVTHVIWKYATPHYNASYTMPFFFRLNVGRERRRFIWTGDVGSEVIDFRWVLWDFLDFRNEL